VSCRFAGRSVSRGKALCSWVHLPTVFAVANADRDRECRAATDVLGTPDKSAKDEGDFGISGAQRSGESFAPGAFRRTDATSRNRACIDLKSEDSCSR